MKPTRCINFWILFLEWNSTCFGQFLCPSSGVFHCTRCIGICHTGLLTACEQDQDGTAVPSLSCSKAIYKPVWHIPLQCVQWKTPDDGQRNCPKYVEFNSKNKIEKLMHLVGFIIRNLSRCTVTWTSVTKRHKRKRSDERPHKKHTAVARPPSMWPRLWNILLLCLPLCNDSDYMLYYQMAGG